MLKPQFTEAPAFSVLTATGRGMDGWNMSRAAQQAFGELCAAIGAAGLESRAWSFLAISPDKPESENDPQCRLLAGVVFDYSLTKRSGASTRPDIPLTGGLAWWEVPAGRYAVFTHIGPYTKLHETWNAIYRDWLPTTDVALGDEPPFELYVNDPIETPPEELRTDIHIPLA